MNNPPAMEKNLREVVKGLLLGSELTYQKIADKSGVPYGAIYYFATRGQDMQSAHMEKLYECLTGKPLLSADHEG